ncbi:MAG: hypothetical protein ACYCWW_12190 [Deltaproteobacteria bacterium]
MPPIVAPYGVLALNGVFEDVAVNNADNPQIVSPGGAGGMVLSARSTRLGLRVNPPLPGANTAVKVSGLAEIDFNGGMIGQGVGAYFPLPRLRLAYASVGSASLRLVAGQDWAIFAPLNPESELHFSIPGFSMAGNLWAREPQIRLEGVQGKLAWAIAALDSAETDPTVASQTIVSAARAAQPGEASDLPAFEARLALQGTLFDRPASIGLSGHYARRHWSDLGPPITTESWVAALDLACPLGAFAKLAEEAYSGQDLAAFFGGIDQGVSVGPRSVTPIHSQGGWASYRCSQLNS